MEDKERQFVRILRDKLKEGYGYQSRELLQELLQHGTQQEVKEFVTQRFQKLRQNAKANITAADSKLQQFKGLEAN